MEEEKQKSTIDWDSPEALKMYGIQGEGKSTIGDICKVRNKFSKGHQYDIALEQEFKESANRER